MQKPILILSIVFFCLLIIGHRAMASGNPLQLSEMSADTVPGTDGAWLELFNTDGKPIDVSGLTVECNGTSLLSIPKDAPHLGGFRFVLIRFSEKVTDLAWKYDRSDGSLHVTAPTKTYVSPPPSYKIAPKLTGGPYPERSPGYVALFRSPSLTEEHLIDFVAWGKRTLVEQYMKQLDNGRMKWATSRNLWSSKDELATSAGLSGLELMEYDVGPWSAYLTRLPFGVTSPRRGWVVTDVSGVTPGTPNKWLDLGYVSVRHLEDGKVLLCCGGFDTRLLGRFADGKPTVRIQIAKDPHFQKIVFDEKCAVEHETSKLSECLGETLYLRFRIDRENVSTDWSQSQTMEPRRTSSR